jgi:uncharacterized protein
LKIDCFNHIAPEKFFDAVLKKTKVREIPPTLVNLDLRFKFMDKFPDVVQILSTPHFDFTPLDNIVDKESNVELCKIANDEMAELVMKYPDRFVGACAAIPMTDIDAAVKEIDRCIKDLGFCGIQLFTNVKGRPLDDPEFRPVFEKMNYYKLPIVLHPTSSPGEAAAMPDTKPQWLSLVTINAPFYTTLTLNRLVFSGMMEDLPDLKVMAHHLGGLLPALFNRIIFTYDSHKVVARGMAFKQRPLRDNPAVYFHRFYGDTVTSGSTTVLKGGLEFFGADRVLFATDAPFDSMGGIRQTGITIRTIESLDISQEDKQKIFVDNAIKLFRLPLTIIE